MPSRTPIATCSRLFWRYLRPHWPRVTELAVLLLASIGPQIALPQILRRFIDLSGSGAGLRPPVGTALAFHDSRAGSLERVMYFGNDS